MPLFRRKPFTIEAVQWDGTNIEEVGALAGKAVVAVNWRARSLLFRTSAGEMVAAPGDWIVRGAENDCYVVKPDIFDVIYEPGDVDD